MFLVAKVKSNSGRVVFRVSDLCLYPEEERVGKEKEDEEIENIFTCLLFPRHCSCETFLKEVILQDKSIMCRHLLAIMISHALNISENIQLNDEDFAEHYYSWV
ncbi:uncharacterized protein B0P05DRAFT_560809, partial [Gilbertella persicaria]|uniref:uncharacterized protein n=1 Tax=Gilbertella persicaria TaxID=101096 RepID=UPI0022203A57